ncbi:hypothetical protein Pfo_031613, partial [Paulownia fortunei]
RTTALGLRNLARRPDHRCGRDAVVPRSQRPPAR